MHAKENDAVACIMYTRKVGQHCEIFYSLFVVKNAVSLNVYICMYNIEIEIFWQGITLNPYDRIRNLRVGIKFVIRKK